MDFDISTLVQGGAVGISLALVALIALLSKYIFKFMENHVDHNTDALIKNAEAQTKLTEILKQDIEIGKETHKLFRNFNNKGR